MLPAAAAVVVKGAGAVVDAGASRRQRTSAGTPEDPVRRGAGGRGSVRERREQRSPAADRRAAARAQHGPHHSRPGGHGLLHRGAPLAAARCISSAVIWTASATVKPPTTTAPAPRSSWSWRAFSMPRCHDRCVDSFRTWNGEEGGSRGERLRRSTSQLQGTPQEPKWLGMVQHDMMMWDHGMPNPDGTLRKEQRREADVNVEFREVPATATEAQKLVATEAMKLAFFFRNANERYATDYPATVGNHMQSTDSMPFSDFIPAISPARTSAATISASDGTRLAPGHRRVRDLHRRRLSSRPERRPDNAGGHRPALRSEGQSQ